MARNSLYENQYLKTNRIITIQWDIMSFRTICQWEYIIHISFESPRYGRIQHYRTMLSSKELTMRSINSWASKEQLNKQRNAASLVSKRERSTGVPSIILKFIKWQHLSLMIKEFQAVWSTSSLTTELGYQKGNGLNSFLKFLQQ